MSSLKPPRKFRLITSYFYTDYFKILSTSCRSTSTLLSMSVCLSLYYISLLTRYPSEFSSLLTCHPFETRWIRQVVWWSLSSSARMETPSTSASTVWLCSIALVTGYLSHPINYRARRAGPLTAEISFICSYSLFFYSHLFPIISLTAHFPSLSSYLRCIFACILTLSSLILCN